MTAFLVMRLIAAAFHWLALPRLAAGSLLLSLFIGAALITLHSLVGLLNG